MRSFFLSLRPIVLAIGLMFVALPNVASADAMGAPFVSSYAGHRRLYECVHRPVQRRMLRRSGRPTATSWCSQCRTLPAQSDPTCFTVRAIGK